MIEILRKTFIFTNLSFLCVVISGTHTLYSHFSNIRLHFSRITLKLCFYHNTIMFLGKKTFFSIT